MDMAYLIAFLMALAFFALVWKFAGKVLDWLIDVVIFRKR